ncbi:MAG: glycosyltransferase [Candidatus Kapaibacteriales bacterium]
MKKVLVIAYYFPPSGGPGVQRVLKHIRFLTEFGWQPTVLTVANGDFPARDESLIKEIPKDINVIRTNIPEPYKYYRKFTGKKAGSAVDVNTIKKDGDSSSMTEVISEFIRSTFFIPDARAFWRSSAAKAIAELFKHEKFDAIYSSSPPYTCSLIARDAKRKYGLPWVAGFRDPWTGFISSPKRWAIPRSIDKGMEHSVFQEADAVEAAWEGITKDAIGKYPNLDRAKFHHVPNGYDPEDYPDSFSPELSVSDKLVITYTGSMYGRRNPKSLFAAFQFLIDTGKIDVKNILLRFIGRFGDEIHQDFDSTSFKDSIEVLGYVPHSKSTEYLMASDLLLLIVDESKESEEIVPGKVYEYIGTGKPVLAISPRESAIERLIEETESGFSAPHSEIDSIAENILKYYNNWIENKKIDYNSKMEKISKYTRKNATKRLAQLLNDFTS